MTEPDELEDRVAALEEELAALNDEPAGGGPIAERSSPDPTPEDSRGNSTPGATGTGEPTGSDLSRRRLLGLSGLAGAASLLSVGSGASSGSARAQAAGSIGSQDSPVDVHAHSLDVQGSLSGELTNGDPITQLAGENLTVTDGRLDAPAGIDGDLADELEAAVAELALVSGGGNTWRFGPETPTGSGHANPLWGIHFETAHETYLGETAIDSESPGWVTFAVYEYDGDQLGSLVDTRRVRTTAALQRVQLDFRLDPGEYLLTRLVPQSADSGLWEDQRDQLHESVWSPADTANLSLIRLDSSFDWADASRNGVTFHGGDHPIYDANDYLYYFYDLQIATKQGQ